MPESVPDVFTVQFSREIARTLDYEDSRGKLVFVFEFGSTGPFTLHRQPLNTRKCVQFAAENRAWLTLACERSRAHLQSCGYEVEVFPSSPPDA